jgi:cytochrome b involved in lipid metabolism
MADVAKHNSANNCWLAISGKAYNVTSYVGSHPGGQGAILNSCGTEVSGIFASIHSNFAWNLLGQYYVGPIG